MMLRLLFLRTLLDAKTRRWREDGTPLFLTLGLSMGRNSDCHSSSLPKPQKEWFICLVLWEKDRSCSVQSPWPFSNSPADRKGVFWFSFSSMRLMSMWGRGEDREHGRWGRAAGIHAVSHCWLSLNKRKV